MLNFNFCLLIEFGVQLTNIEAVCSQTSAIDWLISKMFSVVLVELFVNLIVHDLND